MHLPSLHKLAAGLVLALVMPCCLAAAAQPTALFKKYMEADGLSNNTVLCGLRDSYGFMWLGTNNGLNCFDGSRNTIYRNMVDENATNENNAIVSLFEHDGDIWFGGAFGLYVFHRADNSFSRFNKRTRYGVNISSTVQKIVRGQNGYVWIITLGQGVFIYDPLTGALQQDSRHGAFLSDVVIGSSGHVFMVTLQGQLLIYKPDGEFLRQHALPGYTYGKNTICLERTGGRVYLGCERGLFTISAERPSIERLPLSLPQGGVRAICAKSETELLLGTEQGIYTLNTATQQLQRLDNPSDRMGGLSDKVVNRLMYDRDSTLWVMTGMGGVCYMPTQRSPFTTTALPPSTAGGAAQGAMVRAFCETTDGSLWIGTDEGLYFYDAATQQVSARNPWGTPQEINVLMLDGDDLWIGTRFNGISVMNTQTGQLRQYNYSAEQPYTVTSNEITSLLRTRQGDIYVGTNWSLSRFDRSTEHFMFFSEIGSMTTVTDMAEDASGCLWATSSNHGVYRQRSAGGGFSNYTYNRQQAGSITSNYATTVFCDHRGDVWVATNGDGLCRHRAEADVFERFGTPGSLLQERQVYFIVEDSDHSLWIGTESGVARVDSARSSHVVYVGATGIMLREQKPTNAACMTRRGELFMGGNGAFQHFYPQRLSLAETPTPVYITALSLPYTGEDDASGQQRATELSLSRGDTIRLPYADNSFTLHFSSPRFNDEGALRYEYMLTGVDQTWARGTTTAEATYANVPPGSYEFVLREAGNDDAQGYARLLITILPPWYRTTLAYIIYALVVLFTVAWAVRRYSNTLRRRYNRRMKEFQTQQEKENFESKIRFFINLVHEIRTPLSLISLPLEQMEDSELTDENRRHANAIRRNMNYLLGITNQLLDFQKADSGRVQLNRRPCNVGQLLHDIYKQFDDAMNVQGKRMQLQLPEAPIVTQLDIDKVQKVMMNLVGNAVKYARSEIIIRLEQVADDHLCISVIDDGPGVPPAERSKIFDLYYQIGNDDVAATLGTGLGLPYAKMLAQAHDGDLRVEESVGGGSNFILMLPIVEGKGDATTELRPASEGTDAPAEGTDGAQTRDFRILLVDDNEELLQMMGDALKHHYRIRKARDGREALEVLQHNDIDIIVSDVMMPRMSGTELCQEVKQNVDYSHIPVILLTAKTSVEAKLEGMQSGADIYLEKPFSVKQLHLQIKSLLRMRQNFYDRMRQIDGTASATPVEGEFGMNQQDLQFLQRLQQLVAENLRDEEFSIDVLAEQMAMSRSSFYRKIKALTNMTPIDYMKTQRLERAAQLLRQGGRITEVAEQVGFTSSSYFAKCFKTHFGVLPKDYASA